MLKTYNMGGIYTGFNLYCHHFGTYMIKCGVLTEQTLASKSEIYTLFHSLT